MLLILTLVKVDLSAETPADIQKLVQSRSKQILETERKFTGDIKELKAKYTKSGDMESVNLLVAIDESLRSGLSGAAKDRHWIWHSGGELVLRANGEAMHTEWGRRGKWSLNQDGSIKLEGPSGVFRITFSGGEGQVFHLGKGGKTTISPKTLPVNQDVPIPESAGSRPRIDSIIQFCRKLSLPSLPDSLMRRCPIPTISTTALSRNRARGFGGGLTVTLGTRYIPNGHTTVFKALGQTRVSETEGTILVRWPGPSGKPMTSKDGGLQAFIPDRGSAEMHHWYRNTDRGDTKWNDLAPMKDVK